MKLKHFIDANKGITFFVLLALIAFYRQWDNPTAMIYLALHGSYGMMWVMKSRLFPDKQWEQRTPFWYGILAWLALGLYWLPGWIIVSQSVRAPAWLLSVCVGIFILGVFFHFASDMQKHTALEAQPGKLIVDKMFSLARNINYFGELLIYGAMATLAMSSIAFVPLAIFFIFYWIPNIFRKERSLSRYSNFVEYRRRSKLLIPFVF
jgi:protein-S-isoprenylcysteine O-methyltransferase Ste14